MTTRFPLRGVADGAASPDTMAVQRAVVAGALAEVQYAADAVPHGATDDAWRGPAHTAFARDLAELGNLVDSALHLVNAAALSVARAETRALYLDC